MSDDFERFTAPRADEEIHQGIPSPMAIGTSPTDGLPTHLAARNFDKAPPLTEETLICMADKRRFVVRHDDGSVWMEFMPADVSRTPGGEYYVALELFEQRATELEPRRGLLQLRKKQKLEQMPERQWLKMIVGRDQVVVAVEPVRPECVHYLRMQTDLSADREGRYFARSCMKQKTEEGEFYSLRDQLIGACSIREPRHLESEVSILDKFDEEKIGQARERAEMEEFDVDRALAAEAKGGGLGILGG